MCDISRADEGQHALMTELNGRDRWAAAQDRILSRMISAADFASIFLCNLPILLIPALIDLVLHPQPSAYYQAIKCIEHGSFVLLYLIRAGLDVRKYVKEGMRNED